MASITVKIKSEELDESFLKNIRALFKNRQVSVTFESDDTVALEQIAAKLANRTQEGASYAIPGAAFDDLLQAAESDENYDVVTALKRHRIN
ncbi:MAG: hypothetical protein H7246_07240 [Phycisphaerae bacterium]|nr:hypothetical protein [Saprospiraceae bacterium]